MRSRILRYLPWQGYEKLLKSAGSNFCTAFKWATVWIHTARVHPQTIPNLLQAAKFARSRLQRHAQECLLKEPVKQKTSTPCQYKELMETLLIVDDAIAKALQAKSPSSKKITPALKSNIKGK